MKYYTKYIFCEYFKHVILPYFLNYSFDIILNKNTWKPLPKGFGWTPFSSKWQWLNWSSSLVVRNKEEALLRCWNFASYELSFLLTGEDECGWVHIVLGLSGDSKTRLNQPDLTDSSPASELKAYSWSDSSPSLTKTEYSVRVVG